MQYCVIHNSDGETTVEFMGRSTLLKRLDQNEWGDVGFLENVTNYDTNYWGDKILIIKGDIVVPTPREHVVRHDID